jgi:hypothetical protein
MLPVSVIIAATKKRSLCNYLNKETARYFDDSAKFERLGTAITNQNDTNVGIKSGIIPGIHVSIQFRVTFLPFYKKMNSVYLQSYFGSFHPFIGHKGPSGE